MKAMLLAAGLGTRLKPFTDKHPKALAVVNGKTLLEHNIRYLQKSGITELVINVHHFADQIETALKTAEGFGSNVTVSDERDMVLETGGGIKKAKYFFDAEPFLVMNVDVLTNLDLQKMIEAHAQFSSLATLAIMNRNSSRQLLFDEHLLLCGWTNNNTDEQRISRETAWVQPFAFSGVQILSPEIFDMPFEGKFSMIDVYLHFAKTKIIKGYEHSDDIFIDVGKPESIENAEKLFN